MSAQITSVAISQAVCKVGFDVFYHGASSKPFKYFDFSNVDIDGKPLQIVIVDDKTIINLFSLLKVVRQHYNDLVDEEIITGVAVLSDVNQKVRDFVTALGPVQNAVTNTSNYCYSFKDGSDMARYGHALHTAKVVNNAQGIVKTIIDKYMTKGN